MRNWRAVFALFFLSGIAGLVYQVLWLRQLSYVFGVTAYAASTVLAAFMAGLALGSWLAGPILARICRPLRAFGIAELLVGVAAISTPAALDLASVFYRMLYQAMPDAFAGQTVARFVSAFVVLKGARPTGAESERIAKELRDWVGKEIGPIAKPKDIRFGDNLPKTRSGKIMRRLLRSIAKGEEITQDVSTLENPAILNQLKKAL